MAYTVPSCAHRKSKTAVWRAPQLLFFTAMVADSSIVPANALVHLIAPFLLLAFVANSVHGAMWRNPL